MPTTINADTVLDAYVECALWSSTGYNAETGEDTGPMDDNYGREDIAPEALASMREDIESFLFGRCQDDTVNDAARHAARIAWWATELGESQIGHDFWLTRNGHGAGFWDRFSAGTGYQVGRALTDAAESYGTCDLYVADDGKVYAS